MRSASCALFTPQLTQRLHQPHVCSSVLERRATNLVTVEDFVTQRIGLELDTSLALGGALQVQSVWSSVVISGHQWSSVVISGHQGSSEVIWCHQQSSAAISGPHLQVQSVWSSVVIRGHQRSSGVISSHQQSSVALTCKFSPCVRPRVHTHR